MQIAHVELLPNAASTSGVEVATMVRESGVDCNALRCVMCTLAPLCSGLPEWKLCEQMSSRAPVEGGAEANQSPKLAVELFARWLRRASLEGPRGGLTGWLLSSLDLWSVPSVGTGTAATGVFGADLRFSVVHTRKHWLPSLVVGLHGCCEKDVVGCGHSFGQDTVPA